MNVKDIFSLGIDIAINGFSSSSITSTVGQASSANTESGMTEFSNFLLSAAPYIFIFFLVILTAIIFLKIAINKREKKLGSQPQENRFDLDDFDLKDKKETKENDGT